MSPSRTTHLQFRLLEQHSPVVLKIILCAIAEYYLYLVYSVFHELRSISIKWYDAIANVLCHDPPPPPDINAALKIQEIALHNK